MIARRKLQALYVIIPPRNCPNYPSTSASQSIAYVRRIIPPLTREQRGVLSTISRVAAVVCAIASATLAVYCVVLVYAAATFSHDSSTWPRGSVHGGHGGRTCGGNLRRPSACPLESD